ncbi:hypothetical protein PMI09_05430 [Rhizobium sp. CF122]|nr:hypothetical protein PMI09_05430 [Rhizobium sp. CF122]
MFVALWLAPCETFGLAADSEGYAADGLSQRWAAGREYKASLCSIACSQGPMATSELDEIQSFQFDGAETGELHHDSS